jgi:hypothetical protein
MLAEKGQYYNFSLDTSAQRERKVEVSWSDSSILASPS